MNLAVLKAAILTGGTKFGFECRHESIQSTDYSASKEGVSHLRAFNEWPPAAGQVGPPWSTTPVRCEMLTSPMYVNYLREEKEEKPGKNGGGRET